MTFLMNMQLSQGFPSAILVEGRYLHDRQSSTLSSHGLFRTLGRRESSQTRRRIPCLVGIRFGILFGRLNLSLVGWDQKTLKLLLLFFGGMILGACFVRKNTTRNKKQQPCHVLLCLKGKTIYVRLLKSMLL